MKFGDQGILDKDCTLTANEWGEAFLVVEQEDGDSRVMLIGHVADGIPRDLPEDLEPRWQELAAEFEQGCRDYAAERAERSGVYRAQQGF